MSTLSSANVTDVNLVLKERTHMRLCINMLMFTHNLGNWLIATLASAHQGLTGNLDVVSAVHSTNSVRREKASLLVSVDKFLNLQQPKTHSFIQSLSSAAAWSHAAT